MRPTDIPTLLIVSALFIVLAWASYSDVKSRIIPNLAILIVFVLSLAWIAIGPAGTAISSFEAGGLALTATFILYLVKVLGAGDSKLFAVLSMFAGLAHLPLFAFATAVAGGGMAAVSLAARPWRALAMYSSGGNGFDGRGIPYGVAISVGALVTLWAELTRLPPLST